MKSETERTRRIAQLNDLARQAIGGALSPEDQSAVRERVETFDKFTDDNDPYGERDFGCLDYKGLRIYFKIDYYDATLTYGSEDPADPKLTVRVLTIMLADEY